MKKLGTLLLVITIAFSAFSQDDSDISITKKTSSLFKDKKKNSNLLFSEPDGLGGFITIREYLGGMTQKVKGYHITRFDKNMKQLSTKETEVDNNVYLGMWVDNGIINIIESFHDKKKDVYKYRVLQSPVKRMVFKKKEILALSEDKIKKYFGIGFGPFLMTNGMSQLDSDSGGPVYFSANKNYFAINFDIKNKKQQTQRVYVFNKNLEKVMEREFVRDIKDAFFEYENIDVDDETGAVFLLGKVYENGSKRKKKKGKANYHFELFKITADRELKASFKTAMNFVGSLYTVRGGNTLSCVGFYSNKNDYRFNGVVRFNLDSNDLSITAQSVQPFTQDFIKEKYGKVKDKELKNLSFRSGFLNDNGDIVLNAEEFYVVTRTNMNANGDMSMSTTYHYNDIVSVKIAADGKLVWARNINKRQATNGGKSRHFLSFSSMTNDDDTYLFINCSDKVRKLRNDRLEFKQTRAKKSNLYAIKIDNDGNYSYKSIVDDKEGEVPFMVKQGIPISDDEMVFVGRKGKKKQFLKLKIQ